jgi:hypothetical protein
MRKYMVVFFGCVLGLSAAQARAATILWGLPTNIAGDTDVLNLGSTFAAANFGGAGVPSTTVNSVTFSGFAVTGTPMSVTQGNITLSTLTSLSGSATIGSSASPPFSALTTSYKTLLGPAVSTTVSEGTVSNSLQVTVSNLTVGQPYELELFSNLSSIANTSAVDISGGPALRSNATDTVGGTGQYALGTFIADGSTQSFTVSGDPAGDYGGIGSLVELNAMQVRSVPEPDSVSLLAVSALLAGRRSQGSKANSGSA